MVKLVKILVNCASVLLAFIALSGCVSNTPLIKPVPVEMPVAVSCITEIVPEPVWNVDSLAPEATEAEKLKAILADAELSRGYIDELEAELAGCS